MSEAFVNEVMKSKRRVAGNEQFFIDGVSSQSKEAKYKIQLEFKHSITARSTSPVDDVGRRKPSHFLNSVQKLLLQLIIEYEES